MASFEDIRRGIAANIALVLLPDWQVSAYPLDNPSTPFVDVMGISEVEYATFADANAPCFTWVVEAGVARTSDVAAYMAFDELMDGGTNDLKAAIEADEQLTSRLVNRQGNQAVETGQAAACDDLWVTFDTFQPRVTLPNTVEVLLATWNVRVMT